MVSCVHYWHIEDDEGHRQIGTCQKCKEQKDFGKNPTIISSKGLITMDYFLNPFNGELREKLTFEDREYQYPKPPIIDGRYIPLIESDENDEEYHSDL